MKINVFILFIISNKNLFHVCSLYIFGSISNASLLIHESFSTNINYCSLTHKNKTILVIHFFPFSHLSVRRTLLRHPWQSAWLHKRRHASALAPRKEYASPPRTANDIFCFYMISVRDYLFVLMPKIFLVTVRSREILLVKKYSRITLSLWASLSWSLWAKRSPWLVA